MPVTKGTEEKYCHECGEIINTKAEICPRCGVRQPTIAGHVSGISGQRRCTPCGFTGQMKTWLRNYNTPQLITIILLFFWIVPGLLFIAWGWGKYKCPSCGKVDENVPA